MVDKESLIQFRLRQLEFCENIHPIQFGNHVLSVSLEKKNFTKIYVYSYGDIVSSHIVSFGGWEDNEVKSILELLRNSKGLHQVEDPLFLDIGSNVGWFSFVVASEGFRTVSFEALQNNVQLMRTTLCENPILMERLTLVNRALSETEKTCSILSLSDNYGDGTVSCESNDSNKYNQTIMRLRGKVRMHKLDRYIEESVYVLKIDIEGFELFALKGGSLLFKMYKVYYIVTEINTNCLTDVGLTCEDYARFLDFIGFKLSQTSFEGPFIELSEIIKYSEANYLFNVYGKNKFLD